MKKNIKFLLTCFWFLNSIFINAQNLTISIKMENASLGKILQEIKKQSGKNILYNNTLVDEYKDESVNIENMTLEEALKMCLKNKKLQYKIIDGVIIIEPKNQKINHPAIPKGVSQNIRGQVIDQNSDMPLIGATVVLLNSNPVIGTVT
ncbi:MAG: secretin and TonB N-terminal domain-containing protein, partial [Bacteroidales bacterium]|nr:secretin and TonB N-terminal domain-containing protein [Bacteroidales bacterium]